MVAVPDDRSAVRPATVVLAAAGLLTAVIAASEVWHRQASRSGPGVPAARGSRVIVVLGYPSRRSGRLHPMQKWRTEMAVRSLPAAADHPDHADHVLLFTGGRSRGAAVTEAEAMAAHARSLGVPADRILLETEATSTRENLSLSLPLADSFDTIVIVSDSLHVARARRYAAAQRPDLADRLAFADDYRFLERWWLKVPVAAYELGALLRDRRLRPEPLGEGRWDDGFHARQSRVGPAAGVAGPARRRYPARRLSSG